MNTSQNDHLNQDTNQTEQADAPSLSRRRFLGGLGGAAAAAMTVGAVGFDPLGNPAAIAEAASAASGAAHRRNRAWQVRKTAADYHKGLGGASQVVSGDEARYANRIASYHKGLPHNGWGEVDPGAFDVFVQACDSGDPDDFDQLILGGPRKQVNPLSGLAFDMEGYDPTALTAPAAPLLNSAEQAGEGVELYWMALLRDVNFADYGSDADVAAACADLNRFGADFKGPKAGGRVTPATLFRDPLPGAGVGPYISQFLFLPIPYGAQTIDQKIRTLNPGDDHLTSYAEWLSSQNGGPVARPASFDPQLRYIRNGRDLAEWVHNDPLFQAYFNAALILGTGRGGNPLFSGIGCPPNGSNPYLGNPTQVSFATFGGPHVQALVGEVAFRALKATWYQKWFVHRRLRPEAWGGLVHNQIESNRYPGAIHAKQLDSAALNRVRSRSGSYLLGQAYPEGSPTHPAYTAGHATVAGACVTILKAFFNENFVIPNPVVPSADGLSLQPYTGPALTVGGELNKLVSNIGTGRNIAGVHWRSDAVESFRIGEQVAIGVLRDHKECYSERFAGFTFTRFDGTTITI